MCGRICRRWWLCWSRISGRVIITRNGAASAVLLSPEELETLEILADKKLMLSLLKAEKDELAQWLVTHEDIFS